MPHITTLPTILFYTFLSLIFLFEGLGWRGGREASFALILVMPIFLFILDFILKRQITVPKIPTILYGGFIFFSLISTIFSLDVGRSFLYLLFYIALYGVFLYVYNHREELKKYLIPFIFTLSFIFSVYSIFVDYFILLNPAFFYPGNGAQYVYARYGLHNSRGDVLIIPMVISFYFMFKKKYILFNILSVMFFLPFILYSYSRSALVSLLVVLLCLLVYKWKLLIQQRNIFPMTASFVVMLFLLSVTVITTQEVNQVRGIREIKDNVAEVVTLYEKPLFQDRIQYLKYALLSIVENPLWGVGSDNYIVISQKAYTQLGFTTNTSHNIVIDIISENGSIASLFFLAFIVWIFFKGKKDVLLFGALVVLLNFQTHYSFKIYSFLLLFIIFLGVIIREKKKVVKQQIQ